MSPPPLDRITDRVDPGAVLGPEEASGLAERRGHVPRRWGQRIEGRQLAIEGVQVEGRRVGRDGALGEGDGVARPVDRGYPRPRAASAPALTGSSR